MIQPILWVAVSFTVIFAIADNLLSRQTSSYSIGHPNDFVQRLLSGDPIEITPNGISISADRRGHYSGVGTINNQKMAFMIDTGATLVAVPKDLAKRAGLKFGAQVVSQTAAGNVLAYQTTIPTLQMGSITLTNTRAVIHEKLEVVLIGMAVLKNFKVTQFDGKMAIESS
jgi:aspartyl protease family protein